MSYPYDPATYDAISKDVSERLTEQIELMIADQSISDGRLYALLRDLYIPGTIVTVILQMRERLRFTGFHPSYYDAVNGIIHEILSPMLDMYRPGLAREGNAIQPGKERDKRIRTIKSRGRSVTDKIKGAVKDDESK